MTMATSVDSWLYINTFKYGTKLNIFILLSGIGLIYSFWIQGLIVQVHGIDVSRRGADYFTLSVLNTYIITYFTTAIGLVWGVYISELRYVKLWGFVKFLEICANIWCFIYTVTYYSLAQYIPIIVVALAVGIFIAMSVCNLYCILLRTSITNSEESSDNLNLPTFENISSNIPSVHNISVVN